MLQVTPEEFNMLWKRVNAFYPFEYQKMVGHNTEEPFGIVQGPWYDVFKKDSLTQSLFELETNHGTIRYVITVNNVIIAWFGAFGVMRVPNPEQYLDREMDPIDFNDYQRLLDMILNSHMDMDNS